MSTIPYPSGGIPNPIYLIELLIQNSSVCPSNSMNAPSGTLLRAQTNIPFVETDGNYVGIPGGICFPIGSSKGSVIYYLTSTCPVNGETWYNCAYQFYDPISQTCANVKNIPGTFLGGFPSTCSISSDDDDDAGVLFTTITSAPTSFWSKSKGVAEVTTLSTCDGTPLSYSWNIAQCETSSGGDGDDVYSYESSSLIYCTSQGIQQEYYFGSNCKSKYLLNGYYTVASVNNKNFESDVYGCTLEAKTNITSQSSFPSFSIGPYYQQIDCKKKNVLSTTTIICLTFFIPLIFWILCWFLIVKVFKRGDICIKALCLDNSKKNEGLASQEVQIQSTTRISSV